jgi:import inner membrane translocase subunit TIM22
MMQTSLTKRFRGRIQPMQMPTYESMMQEDFMNNCAVRSTIAGGMGGMLGVAFGIFTASLDTQVRCTAVVTG